MTSGTTIATVDGRGPTTCLGLVTGANLPGNVEAPAGSCRLVDSTVGHDLTVDSGASVVLEGSSVGHDMNSSGGAVSLAPDSSGAPSSVDHDLDVDHAPALAINGARVGRDLHIEALPPSPIVTDLVCSTDVGRDLTVEDNSATMWIGDSRICGPDQGNTVGHDLVVTDNAAPPAVPSSAGLDLPDVGVFVSSEVVGHNLVCGNNQPAVNSAAGTNTVKHRVACVSSVSVTGGTTSLVLSPGIVAFFASQSITVGATGPATFDPGTETFSTPTTAGTLVGSPLTAQLNGNGGISLSGPGFWVGVDHLDVSISATPTPGAGTISGDLSIGGTLTPSFVLATFSLAPPATAAVTPADLQVTVDLQLSDQAAQALSLATGVTIPAGTPFATATITATS
jgi:hypothetical protein